METYYQESGRAGRDGLPSECVLFFRPADVPRQSSMVFYENSGLQNLYDIVRYCQSRRHCRRSAFFRHFAEPVQDCNGMCDNCAFSSEVEQVDVSGPARLIVSLLQETRENDQRLTALQLVDKVKGKQKELGSDLKREELEQLVLQLITDHVLKEEFQHTAYTTNSYVTIGPLAKQLLQGKKIIKLEIPSREKTLTGNKRSKHGLTFTGLELKLDELRKELCSINVGILPHSVFSSQQIGMISTQKPCSIEELEMIVGKLKTQKYGARILEEIKKYMDTEEPADKMLNEEQGRKNRSRKKLKTERALVLIESSEDEA